MAEAKATGSMMMVHKDFSDREPTKVSRHMFERVWKEKGWQEVKEDKASSSSASGSKSGSGS